MTNPYEIINSPLRTEKGTRLAPYNKYIFWVDRKASKIEIRNAVEEIYKVNVTKVNTLMVRGKKRRVRLAEGKTSDWKKAVVTLKAGEKIDIA